MKKDKTFKWGLLAPLRDKERTMKLNYFLSNNYVLAIMVIVLDLFLFFASSYILNVIPNIPQFLLSRDKSVTVYFGVANLIPHAMSTARVIVSVLILAVVDMIFIYKVKVSFSELDFNVGQKGVERFLNEDEIKQQYKCVEQTETPYAGMPGILISRIDDKFYIDDSIVNNLIIGITRSGKGEMFAKTSIETYSRAEVQPSMLIGDPKLEHYKVFKEVFESRGYDVYLLNCSNPALSMGYNPLSLILDFYRKKDYDTAEMIANSFAFSYFNVDEATGDMRYFVSAASDLCVAMILAAVEDAFMADELYNQERYEKWKMLSDKQKESKPFQYKKKYEKTITFYSMIINFGNLVTEPVDKQGVKTMLDVFFEKRPQNDRAKLKYLSTRVAPGKTKAGVFSEMLRELSIFTLHNVAKMTAESSLNLKDIGFGEKPIAVFMATPSYDKSLYKIPTIFLRQVYYALGKECDEHKGRCSRLVKCILDEAGNMPPIELIDTMTTMGLGQWFSMDFYLQNYEQLDETYGEKVAATIKGNCGNHFFIQTKSTDTAKAFSEMLGDKSFIDVQRAGSKLSADKYFTESVNDRPLLYENQLLNLQEGECVIHRTMKRRDNKWKKIVPYPIFNSIENGHYLKYAYEFFPDKYKHPNEVNFIDICTESREHINPEELIWDVNLSFQILNNSQIRILHLEDIDYKKIKEILSKLLGRNFSTELGITPKTSIANFLDWLGKEEAISPMEKETILAIIKEEVA